jgi:hypothetical protein
MLEGVGVFMQRMLPQHIVSTRIHHVMLTAMHHAVRPPDLPHACRLFTSEQHSVLVVPGW